jgi:hypothetical protein
MPHFELWQWIAFAVIGVVFLVGNLGLPKLGGVKLPSFGLSGGDDEYQDMLALHRLESRFERLGCPEGQGAMKTVGEHFFHKDAKATVKTV